MSPVEIDYSGEGTTDAEAARKMILAAGALPGRDFTQRKQPHGKAALDKRLRGYNAGAAYTPILVLRDLDQENCAVQSVQILLPRRHPDCLLRIAVRSLDAWLLADREVIARFAKVPMAEVPHAPETLAHPKRSLVQLLRHTKDRETRRRLDLDTEAGPTWQQLGGWSGDFIRLAWDPRRAAASGVVPSLSRAILRLQAVAKSLR